MWRNVAILVKSAQNVFFFLLKKMALKLRYEKKVRGEILGGHDGIEF